jgi:hypothetical protein
MKLSRIKKRILAMVAIPIAVIVALLLIAVMIVYAKWTFILFVVFVFGYVLWTLTDEIID